MKRIGAELNARPNFLKGGSAFEYNRPHAFLSEAQRSRQTSDTAPGDGNGQVHDLFSRADGQGNRVQPVDTPSDHIPGLPPATTRRAPLSLWAPVSPLCPPPRVAGAIWSRAMWSSSVPGAGAIFASGLKWFLVAGPSSMLWLIDLICRCRAAGKVNCRLPLRACQC